ncbi:MAG: PKD domain-containing protein, partial [Bacteroidales bacterium]
MSHILFIIFTMLMKLKVILYIFLFITVQHHSYGQMPSYDVSRTSFSSDRYHEFSPVFFDNGIVFCSTRDNNTLINYTPKDTPGYINIFYVDTTEKVTWRQARSFSKNLNTRLNEGPVTFNENRDTLYYSRNQIVEGRIRNISEKRNRLGLFTAVLKNGSWEEVNSFRFNSEWYNISTPHLAPGGDRVYFAADMPGGYGGSDLYYSSREKGYWSEPVNLGPVINTESNEAYPFTNQKGELFFSSDNERGYGGKDIYYTRKDDDGWLEPVLLDKPLNSEYDDFGLVADATFSHGYFSTDRDGSIDIFKFSVVYPQIFYTDRQKPDNYCLSFGSENNIRFGSFKLEYQWDFENGDKIRGDKADHCFPGPGSYRVTKSVVDSNTGAVFFVTEVLEAELLKYEQPVISGDSSVVVDEAVYFDATESYLPGYDILDYSWDFGDGARARGREVSHTYGDPGEYRIRLGVTLRDQDSGKIYKRGVYRIIHASYEAVDEQDNILKDEQHMASGTEGQHKIKKLFSVSDELQSGAISRVVLFESETAVNLGSNRYNDIRNFTYIKQVYSEEKGVYQYIIDEQLNIMDTYLTFKKALDLGYADTKVITYRPVSQAEKTLINLKKIFSLSSDDF